MTDKQDLIDQIEDMDDASEEIAWRHKKKIEDLIQDILDGLKKAYNQNSMALCRTAVRKLIEKYERKQNE